MPALRPKYSSDCTLVGLGRGQRSAFSPHQRTPDRHTFGPAGDDDPRPILSTPIMSDGMSSPAPFYARRSCRGKRHMVQYIKSDLEFILAADQDRRGARRRAAAVRPGRPHPRLQPLLGLRTVDGTYNHLLPGQEKWGAADSQFPHLLDPDYRPADGTLFDPDGPGPAPGDADRAELQSFEQSRTRWSSIPACAPSPTCSSTRRWAIRPRS